MIVGLGTGSTARFAIEALIRRVREGLRIRRHPHLGAQRGAGARRAASRSPASPSTGGIDVTIDGADEIELGTLNLIKGLGGALLREKIVAAASDRLVIVADEPKLVERLGGTAPVPVEVVPFGWETTADRLRRLGDRPAAEAGRGRPAVLHRRRQPHPRLPVRHDRRSGRPGPGDRSDRRRGGNRPVHRHGPAGAGRRRRTGVRQLGSASWISRLRDCRHLRRVVTDGISDWRPAASARTMHGAAAAPRRHPAPRPRSVR